MMVPTRFASAGLGDLMGYTSARSECYQASLWLCYTETTRVPHFFRIRTAQERATGLGLPEFEATHLCLQRQADLVYVCQRVVDDQSLCVTEKWTVQKCAHRGIHKALRYAPGILIVPREVCQLITQFAEKNTGPLECVRQTTFMIPKPVMR